MSPQAVLAAHITRTPDLIATLNDTGYVDVPGAIGDTYKLRAEDIHGNPGPVSIAGIARSLDVGQAPGAAFAIRGITPNPVAGGMVRVDFVLPRSGPVSIDILDVGGRRVAGHALGVIGAGLSTVRLDTGPRGAGVRFLRLTHSGRSITRKLAMLE